MTPEQQQIPVLWRKRVREAPDPRFSTFPAVLWSLSQTFLSRHIFPTAACPDVLVPHIQTVHLLKYYVCVCTLYIKGHAVTIQESVLSPVSAIAQGEWREWAPWTKWAPGTGEAAGEDTIGNGHGAQGCIPGSMCRHRHMGLSQADRRVTVCSST